MAEFKKAMREMNISLSDTELRKLFEHFDSDGNDGVDFDEFIKGVRYIESFPTHTVIDDKSYS